VVLASLPLRPPTSNGQAPVVEVADLPERVLQERLFANSPLPRPKPAISERAGEP
jgi:hypothetical protein